MSEPMNEVKAREIVAACDFDDPTKEITGVGYEVAHAQGYLLRVEQEKLSIEQLKINLEKETLSRIEEAVAHYRRELKEEKERSGKLVEAAKDFIERFDSWEIADATQSMAVTLRAYEAMSASKSLLSRLTDTKAGGKKG